VTPQLLKKERGLRIVPTLGATTDMLQLGRRLRQLRTSRGIGVRTLARMINVSPSLISHIELGKGAPSVKTLYALVAAFDVPLSEIFAEVSGASRPSRANGIAKPATVDDTRKPEAKHGSNRFIQRGDTRRAIRLEHGFRWECLTPGTDPEVEFMETVIAVGGGRPDSEMKTHNGTEYGIVLSGKLGIKIAFDTFILGPRDSIRFESNLPHCMWNAGDEPVHSIWFVRGRSPG
jgi:transcriptional regulator with XRE-family HTH domain